jgi:pimeloyl-ACP methyl ester carboxylesterase
MLIEIPHDGTIIRARDHGGAGRPLLLLHGALLSADSFAAVVPALAPRRRCIVAELPGHGASRYPGTAPDIISVQSMSAGIAALLEHLGGGVDVVGESMGGIVALPIVARQSPLIRSLTLIGVVPDPETAENQGPYHALADRLANEGWFEDLIALLLSMYLSPAAQADRGPAGAPARLRRTICANDPRNIAGMIRGSAARPDQRAALARIRCPTHVLIPEHDLALAPSRQADMAKAIPGAVATVIPHAGHCACLEQPQAVAAAILAFPRS